MELSLELLLAVMFALIVVIIGLVFTILYNKWANKKYYEYDYSILNFIATEFKNEDINKKNTKRSNYISDKFHFLEKYIDYCQVSNRKDVIDKILILFQRRKIDKLLCRQLFSLSKYKRMQAAVYLGYIPLENTLDCLEKAVVKEKKYLVKIHIVEALSKHKKISSIPFITQSIIGSPEWYKKRVFVILSDFENLLYDYLINNLDSDIRDIQELIIFFAENYPDEKLKNHLIEKAIPIDVLKEYKSGDYELSILASKALAKHYYKDLNDPHFLFHENIEVRKIAIQAVSKHYEKKNIEILIPHLTIPETRKTTITAISEILRHKPEFSDVVVEYFDNENLPELKLAFAQILSNRLEYFIHLLKFEKGKEKERNLKLIEALISDSLTSSIISFLNTNKDIQIENELIDLIKKILDENNLITFVNKENVVDFLEKNFDNELEKKILSEIEINTNNKFENIIDIYEIITDNSDNETNKLIQSIVKKNELKIDFGTYLRAEILQKLKLSKYKVVKPKRTEHIEKDKIKLLKSIHIAIYLFFPVLYTFWHFSIIRETPFLEQAFFYLIILVFPAIYSAQHLGFIRKMKNWELIALGVILMIIPILTYMVDKHWIHLTTFFIQAQLFVLDFNYYLIFYSLSINLIYVVLLIFSYFGLKEQVRFSKLKKNTFLYKNRVLPSISIIAPAYAEEETIIESVNSQLNLQYPDYELVVVSDGSPDNTLKVLIDYFELERVDVFIEEQIETQPIRSVYKNEKDYPKLTVIDKANGGKADALNVGINVSKNDFFCGIDSDSLLEPDALIKLSAMLFDTDKESVAFGGNILPINSCKVHKGKLETIQIPQETLAAFQTIEYIRAFMSGRVGWAYINSLLIISGAFGLFKKSRVIEMGGYLTGKSRYKKDTVGEDMELVVRLNRFMLEKKIPYSIHYCFNANCWTEVPELLKMPQIEAKSWKKNAIISTTSFLRKIKFISEEKMLRWQEKLIRTFHIRERMKILVNQRDRWHRGLIDILNFHKDMVFRPRYKQIGLVSLPYFFIFEMVGPLIEFQGYVMVVFAAFIGILNLKVAILLFISSIMLGIVISLSSLLISEKEANLFSKNEIGKLIYYAFVENFGPRQIANFWRIRGFFSSMELPKGWGQMLRKSKPTIVLGIIDEKTRNELGQHLENLNCKIINCNDGNSALYNIKKENIKGVILDENLSVINALNISREMKKLPAKREIPIAIISENQQYVTQESGIIKEFSIFPISEKNIDKKIVKAIEFVKQKIIV